MAECCRNCGRTVEGGDNISWRYFGVICGNCFLLYADYVLKNIEGMEAEQEVYKYAPWVYGEA